MISSQDTFYMEPSGLGIYRTGNWIR